jgi:hypothetical protein
VSGDFAAGDPSFVGAATGDFRLGAASFAIDRIPEATSVPATDYFGGPRPRGYASEAGAPQSDFGAIEMQP